MSHYLSRDYAELLLGLPWGVERLAIACGADFQVLLPVFTEHLLPEEQIQRWIHEVFYQPGKRLDTQIFQELVS